VGLLLGRECAQLVGQPFARLFSGDRKRIARIERIIRIVRRSSLEITRTVGRGTVAPNTLARFEAALFGSAGVLIPCRVLVMSVREGGGASVALCDLRRTKALKQGFKARRKRNTMKKTCGQESCG
jgi:hypothetical protein